MRSWACREATKRFHDATGQLIESRQFLTVLLHPSTGTCAISSTSVSTPSATGGRFLLIHRFGEADHLGFESVEALHQ
jgi:hypothetical protein